MQLLHGEPQSSAEADDIVHWRDVYAELTSFLEQAFALCQKDGEHASRMKGLLAEMVERHSFWSLRGVELSSPKNDWGPN